MHERIQPYLEQLAAAGEFSGCNWLSRAGWRWRHPVVPRLGLAGSAIPPEVTVHHLLSHTAGIRRLL